MSWGFRLGTGSRTLGGAFSPSTSGTNSNPNTLNAAAISAGLLLSASSSANGTPESPAMLASRRLLEGIEGGEGGLQGAYRRLSMADQRALRTRFGSRLDEFFSLSTETCPELFYSELLSMGRAAQNHDDEIFSAALFQSLAEGTGAIGSSIPIALRQRAQTAYDALRGVGSFGQRFEYLGRHFVREASDPGMILGMGVAGTVFSAMRLGVLSRLALRPASFWTRGFVAGALASTTAFPAEVLAFWGTTRAYGQLAHPETQRWDRQSITHELASLTLTLGLLKVSGAAAEGLFDRVHGINALTGEATRLSGLAQFSRGAFQQIGMFGGIAAGHFAETRLGLRPATSGDTFWTDSLVTLLQFNVGGRLSQEVLGPGHAARMQALAMQTQAVSQNGPRLGGGIFSWNGFGNLPVTAEGVRIPVPDRQSGPKIDAVFMSSNEGEEEGAPSTLSPAGAVAVREVRRPSSNTLDEPFKAFIQGLMNRDIPLATRYEVSRELYQDLGLARRVFVKAREESGASEPITAFKTLDQALHHLNREHFEGLSDHMQEWNGRFQFLQSELRQRVNQGRKAQRRVTRRLLESVQLKMLETRRYHNDAESYLGDDKGPGPKSVFAPENYSRLVQRFSDISTRLARYAQDKPVAQKILSRYRSELPSRHPDPVDRTSLEAEIRRTPMSVEHQDSLWQALEDRDPLLAQLDLFPLNRWLRTLNAQGPLRRNKRAWKSLESYLDFSAELRRVVNTSEIRKWEAEHELLLNPQLPVTADAREDLTRLIPADSVSSPEALAMRYIDASRPVSEFIAQFRPQPRLSPTLLWGELRTQLLRLGDRQILHRDTVQGLLDWFDPNGPRSGNGSHSPPSSRDRAAKPPPSVRAQEGGSVGIHAIREEAVAGMIDFLRKGSHTPEVQRELSDFIGEVVRRRDIRMMSVLAIYFQNYQLGMMRDRIQIRQQPSTDTLSDQMAVEAYDRFLVAMRKTAHFYRDHPQVRGSYFEIFEKMEGGKDDSSSRLAVPVLHRTEEFLAEGYSVDLLSRGGLGEAVLFASHPDGRKQAVTATSVLDPLAGRQHLEHWLDRAERELLHNGQYLTRDHGEHPLSISLHLFKIRPGVSKRDISQWARDYLERHPALYDIQLIYPKTGNEAADPFDVTFYRNERVMRSLPTTEAMIENRVRDLATRPQDLSNRLELFRLRQEWIQHLHDRDPDLRGLLVMPSWSNNLKAKITEIQSCLQRLRDRERELVQPAEGGTEVAARTASQELDGILESIASHDGRLQKSTALLQSGEEVLNYQRENWDLLRATAAMFPDDNGVRSLVHRAALARSQEIEGRGDNHLATTRPGLPEGFRQNAFLETSGMVIGKSIDPGRLPRLLDLSQAGFAIEDLRWSYGDRGLTIQGDVVPTQSSVEAVEGEPNSGFFSIRMAREPRKGELQFYFDTLTLPPHLQGKNAGTIFFRELVRLGRQLGAKTIITADVSGDHRYSLAVFGMRFRNEDSRRRMLSPFQVFVESYLMKIPAFSGYVTSALLDIHTPRELAYAHLDPVTRGLSLDPWNAGSVGNPIVPLPDHFQVGKLFLLSDAPSYQAYFELRDDSYSMRTFSAYLNRRLGRGFYTDVEEN